MMAEGQSSTERVTFTTRSAEEQAPGVVWYEARCDHETVNGYLKTICEATAGLYHFTPVTRRVVLEVISDKMRHEGRAWPSCGCWDELVYQYGPRMEVCAGHDTANPN